MSAQDPQDGAGHACAHAQDQQDDAGYVAGLPGREQLMLSSPELQTRLGRKFVDEAEFLPLLVAHGLIRFEVATTLGRRSGSASIILLFDASSVSVDASSGMKFADEAEFLALLVAHGLIRRVRTIRFEVRTLGGEGLTVTLEVSKANVGSSSGM
jgi:hypothetical protein